MKLVVLIPAYNEEKTIGHVLVGIPTELTGITQAEVVVIDDASTDKTSEIARHAGAEVISHIENRGVGAAFSTGIEAALAKKADVVVTIDADGQLDTNEIPKLLEPILFGKADVVLGSRFLGNRKIVGIPAVKYVGNKLMANFISWICGKKFSDVSCGFRAYSREALLHLNLFGGFTYTQETVLNLSFKGLKIIEIPVSVKYFQERTSAVTGHLLPYTYRAMKIIFRTVLDYKPLKVFGIAGALIFILGMILDVIMLYIFFKTGQFTPYKYIGISGLILNAAGIILIIVGLVADILNRIRLTQERILYYQKKRVYGD